ncbi:MAG: MBL fold metallo-hydrolase [Syntrophomonadaceae bacterium]
MIKEVLSGIFRIKIPLPNNPLRYLNSYLIKGKKRSLLVDTGFNWPECKKAQLEGIKTLGANWHDIDFFITHVHSDHCGLVYDLIQKGTQVYCSRTDAELMQAIEFGSYLKEEKNFLIQNGFPERMILKDDIYDYTSGSNIDFTYVDDGDILNYGSYNLMCISTPGHSPGHICLYEPEHKFLISGDHILGSITSNITAWGGVDDFLGHYLASLDKIDTLDISLALPGHRQLIYNCHSRINEIKLHHQKRIGEILNILRSGSMNAYQVASFMHWDLTYKSWGSFPKFQKWFATGEAIAHLEYLTKRNQVQKIKLDKSIVYSLALANTSGCLTNTNQIQYN